jgi:hypothetical protein
VAKPGGYNHNPLVGRSLRLPMLQAFARGTRPSGAFVLIWQLELEPILPKESR